MRKTRYKRALSLLSLIFFGSGLLTSLHAADPSPESIRVMSFNIWVGGEAGKQPLSQTVEVIKASGADVVGLQETAGVASSNSTRPDHANEIAEALGWNCFRQAGNKAIISRFKIVSPTPEQRGVKLETPTGSQLYVFNIHLAASPYQPYQLLKIAYGNAPFLTTAEEAVLSAQETRGGEIGKLLAEVEAILPEGLPVFITGDFNEPSHRDWNADSVAAKHCPLEVKWPTTSAVEAIGFLDSYRTVYPDAAKHRGLTWTPITKLNDPKDHHDRIDFVFVGRAGAKIKTVQIVGESTEFADIIVTPYPSDHRAVVAEVELTAAKPEAKKSSAQ